ncbi:hypothetical protein MZK49_29160 [Ensifer sesbaniae]|uniref:hypothetical protein n=1 Tax=Ensifer sesbaniae TaxID=1214071 RepID=UPI002000BDFB|nr:hypothetical protein [Ensifer sesbaniae]
MISERDFANNYGFFWRETMPNLESVTRSLNLGSTTEWPPMPELSNPGRRDLVSETAYRLAELQFNNRNIDAKVLYSHAQAAAMRDISRLTRHYTSQSPAELTGQEIDEVFAAFRRIYGVAFAQARFAETLFRPHFPGHGFIGDCEGDLRSGSDLFEFKYVSRSFRSSDFKQALVYIALHWLSTGAAIDCIRLINPFRGAVISVRTDELLNASGAISLHEFCHRFSYCTSAGDISR